MERGRALQDTFADTTYPAGRAALFLDLDDFKAINDSYGHEFGDRVLTVIAARIQACLRPDDLAARIGGDEFAVLLPRLGDADTARAITQRLTDRLAQPITVDAVTVECRASIGLAYTDGPVHLDSLLREADTALYTAKAHGKGRWRQYQEGMSAPIRRHLNDRRRIQTALTHSTLAVYYQPIIELATDTVVGFEALIRLHDDQPPMAPREVIAVAENTGLITAVGDYVLRQALAALAELNPPHTALPRYVSVNISARQLQHDSFPRAVRAALAATATDPTLLVLEITESELVSDDHAWDLLAQLRHDGIRIAIDDYGTGYSSLAYLRRPGIDIIKTDQSFLTDSTPRTRILLDAVTTLCHRLHLTQIAEGVQDQASKQTLLTLGCPYGQGFLYAPAMPLTQAAHWPPP